MYGDPQRLRTGVATLCACASAAHCCNGPASCSTLHHHTQARGHCTAVHWVVFTLSRQQTVCVARIRPWV